MTTEETGQEQRSMEDSGYVKIGEHLYRHKDSLVELCEKPKLGDEVYDLITGIVGTYVGYAKYIDGREQILVQPRVDKDGRFVEAEWVNASGIRKNTLNKEPTGFKDKEESK